MQVLAFFPMFSFCIQHVLSTACVNDQRVMILAEFRIASRQV